jgi:hypothetical protein
VLAPWEPLSTRVPKLSSTQLSHYNHQHHQAVLLQLLRAACGFACPAVDGAMEHSLLCWTTCFLLASWCLLVLPCPSRCLCPKRTTRCMHLMLEHIPSSGTTADHGPVSSQGSPKPCSALYCCFLAGPEHSSSNLGVWMLSLLVYWEEVFQFAINFMLLLC